MNKNIVLSETDQLGQIYNNTQSYNFQLWSKIILSESDQLG